MFSITFVVNLQKTLILLLLCHPGLFWLNSLNDNMVSLRSYSRVKRLWKHSEAFFCQRVERALQVSRNAQLIATSKVCFCFFFEIIFVFPVFFDLSFSSSFFELNHCKYLSWFKLLHCYGSVFGSLHLIIRCLQAKCFGECFKVVYRVLHNCWNKAAASKTFIDDLIHFSLSRLS